MSASSTSVAHFIDGWNFDVERTGGTAVKPAEGKGSAQLIALAPLPAIAIAVLVLPSPSSSPCA